MVGCIVNKVTCTRVYKKVEKKFHHPSEQELAVRINKFISMEKSLHAFFFYCVPLSLSQTFYMQLFLSVGLNGINLLVSK